MFALSNLNNATIYLTAVQQVWEGRLQHLRDQDGNILKSYKYQNKSMNWKGLSQL